MPPGRKPNLDAKIARLVSDLRKALVARETSRIEATVAKSVDALVASMQSGVHIGGARPVQPTAATMTPAPGVVAPAAKRQGRSAASRALQARKMKAYWAAKKAKGAGKSGKATKSAPTADESPRPKAASKGRSRQIEAMKAYWATKNAAKAKAAPAPAASAPAK